MTLKQKGFTLIELMIVIVIIGILASIAYPSYRNSITAARRTDAQTSLLNMASRLEQFYSENHTYAGATIATAAATDILSSATSPEGWYTLAITAATAAGYTVTATPRNAQGTMDTRCQTLTFNNLGIKGVANGPSGAPTEAAAACW